MRTPPINDRSLGWLSMSIALTLTLSHAPPVAREWKQHATGALAEARVGRCGHLLRARSKSGFSLAAYTL